MSVDKLKTAMDALTKVVEMREVKQKEPEAAPDKPRVDIHLNATNKQGESIRKLPQLIHSIQSYKSFIKL